MSRTLKDSYVPKIKDGCIAYDQDWQYPAITEQYAYQCLKSKMDTYKGVLYLAFPWASLFDGLARETDLGRKLLTELDKIVEELESHRSMKVITVCQHIKFRDHFEYFKKVNITDLFCSHNVKDEHHLNGINLHPFQIFPVQAYDDNKKSLGIDDTPIPFDEKKYLYSFIGAYDSKYYLTGSRRSILEQLKNDSSFIAERLRWHFERRVYDEQVYGKSLTETELSEEQNNAIQYIEILKDSKFSLCPSGTGPNSIRLWESIEYGSIPVILADTLALPGDQELWEKACVFVSEDRASIEEIPELLNNIANDRSLLKERLDSLSILRSQLGVHNFTDAIEKLAYQYTLYDDVAKNFILDTQYLEWDGVVQWVFFIDQLCQSNDLFSVVYLRSKHEIDIDILRPERVRIYRLVEEYVDFTKDHVCLFDSQTISSKILNTFDTLYINPVDVPRFINADIFYELKSSLSSKDIDDPRYLLWQPKCSIMTSMFNGDEYIDGFLSNLSTFDGLDNFEIFIVRPESPGKEHSKLISFGRNTPGSVYIWLAKDPGLYDVWNLCVRLSTAKYCTNANIDDRRGASHITSLIQDLDTEIDVDVASTAIRVTDDMHMSWEKSDECMVWYKKASSEVYEVTSLIRKSDEGEYVANNIPHCMPVWRTSLHANNGYFDERRFGPSSDWEFWLRCGRNGTKYYLHSEALGLYYRAPESYWRRDKDAPARDQKIVSLYTDPVKGFLFERPNIPDSIKIEEIVKALRKKDNLYFFTRLAEYLGESPDLKEGSKLFDLIYLISTKHLGIEMEKFSQISNRLSVARHLTKGSPLRFVSTCLRAADLDNPTVRKLYFDCANEIEIRYDDGTGLLLKALIYDRTDNSDLEKQYLNYAHEKDAKSLWVNINNVYGLTYPLAKYLSLLDNVPKKSDFSWTMDNPKIFFFPDYSHANPYQDLLYKSFVKNGIEINGLNRLTSGLVEENGLKAGDVFHLHWINILFHKQPREDHKRIADDFLSYIEILKTKGIILIWTVHNRYTHDVADIEIEREFRVKLSAMVDKVLIHHPMIEYDIQSWLSPSATVEIVEHGNYDGCYSNKMTKQQARLSLGIGDYDLVVAVIGQIREYKDMSEKIIALSTIAKTTLHFKLVVAGKVSCKNTKAALDDFPADNLVLVNTFIKDDDLQVYVNAADFILLSYRDILTSGTLFEVMTFGKPVLAPALSSIQYYVVDHINGFLYKNIDDLLELLQRISRLRSADLEEMEINALASSRQLDWPRPGMM